MESEVRNMIGKICFAASSGGHLEEISKLKALTDSYESFLFTEKGEFEVSGFCDKVYYVHQMNRKELFCIFCLPFLIGKSIFVLWKENPDCIISTGALATFPICVIGKIMGKKVIYIESLARVTHISKTGQLMKNIADLFIVQWKDLLKLVPSARYIGNF